jgi:hypothetical protein
MTRTEGDQPRPDVLVAGVGAVGGAGPVFVVADNDAIGSRAPDWARHLAAAGWLHRVRFWEGPADEPAIARLAAEARAFGAGAIVASGGPPTRGVARKVAAAIGVPCVVDGP